MSPRTRNAFCWLVGFGWLANLLAGMVPQLDYTPSPLATAPMMLLLGAMFSTGRRRGKDDSE